MPVGDPIHTTGEEPGNASRGWQGLPCTGSVVRLRSAVADAEKGCDPGLSSKSAVNRANAGSFSSPNSRKCIMTYLVRIQPLYFGKSQTLRHSSTPKSQLGFSSLQLAPRIQPPESCYKPHGPRPIQNHSFMADLFKGLTVSIVFLTGLCFNLFEPYGIPTLVLK